MYHLVVLPDPIRPVAWSEPRRTFYWVTVTSNSLRDMSVSPDSLGETMRTSSMGEGLYIYIYIYIYLTKSPMEPFGAGDLCKFVLKSPMEPFGTGDLWKFVLNLTWYSCLCDPRHTPLYHPLWMINQTARQCCTYVIISLVRPASNRTPGTIHVWCLSPNFITLMYLV